jgi:hypothetical protein
VIIILHDSIIVSFDNAPHADQVLSSISHLELEFPIWSSHLELDNIRALERTLLWYIYTRCKIIVKLLWFSTVLLFTQMNAKVIFSRLLQTFKFSLPENYELVVVQRAAVQPKDDVYCTLKYRM